MTLFSAAQTFLVEGLVVAGRHNEIAAEFGDDCQAVVRRLWNVPRETASKRPLSAAAPAAATAAADLTFLQQGAAPAVAQTADLYILLAAGFKDLLLLRLGRRYPRDDRRAVSERIYRVLLRF